MKKTPNSKQPLRVFLCYSSENKIIVRELYHRLRTDGFEPWLDEENLLPNQDRHHEIKKAVRDSDAIVVCISNASINKRGHFQKEIEFVLDAADQQPEGTVFIVPLRLERCEVPESLSRWHWVDLFDRRGYRQLKKALSASQKVERPKQTSTKKQELEAEIFNKDYRYPPGVIIATTQMRDIMRGKLGEQVFKKEELGSFINTLMFVPERKWLGMFTDERVPLVRNPAEHDDTRLSTWAAVMMIGADVFRIENGLLSPEALSRQLKRAALLFDRIAIYDLVPSLAMIADSEVANELRWLWENDIICQPEVEDREYPGLSEEYQLLYRNLVLEHSKNQIAIGDTVITANKVNTAEADEACFRIVAEALDNATWWQVRSVALWFHEIEHARVVPILENPPQQVLKPRPELSEDLLSILEQGLFTESEQRLMIKPKTGDVVRIILKALPLPTTQTSWQDLLAYRNDPQSRLHLLALRNWANDTARSELPPYEVADKLEWLIEQYRTHIELYKLKFQSGRAELLLTTTGAIEELIHLRPRAVAQSLLDLKQNKLELLEHEIDAPGSEVAYIIKSEQTFEK